DLTLTAADTLIFVEKPFSFSTYYQSLNRADRIDLTRKKQKVEIISMVGVYPEGVAEQQENKNLKVFFGNDSIPEILEERLQGMEKVYRLVMDGRLTDQAANVELKAHLSAHLKGVRFEEKLPERRPEIKQKKRLRAVATFGRLYDRLSGDPTTEAQMVRLASLFGGTSLNPSNLAGILEGVFFRTPS